ARVQTQPFGYSFADSNLRRIRILPPCAVDHLVALRRSIGPAQFGALEHPHRKMLALVLIERLAIERNEPPRRDRQHVGHARYARMPQKERLYARHLVRTHIDKKNIR